MTTKRVAFVTVHECPLASSEGKERGGINVYTFELGKALSRRGWHVDAFTRVQDDIFDRIASVNENFRVIHLPNGPHTQLSKSEILKNLPEFTGSLNAFMKKESLSYDVIHAHYYLSGIVAHQLSGRRQPATPVVMTFHTLGLMKQLVSRSKDTEDPKDRVALERELAATAQSIITSSEIGKQYTASFYDAPMPKIAVIPPGVDTTLFQPVDQKGARKQLGMDADERLILAVGRIDPVKGFDVLLSAVKILFHRNPALSERICVAIVGGDVEQDKDTWSQELARLNDLSSALHLTATVRFIPPQPQEKLPLYYSASDVVVMPSHYESFGMVALEAIACGKPMIATDVTGISPILKDLPQGHIVSANNPIALAREIEHVLQTPHQGLPAGNGIKRFDWAEIAAQMERLYAGLSGNGR